jgi:hypothetical protein
MRADGSLAEISTEMSGDGEEQGWITANSQTEVAILEHLEMCELAERSKQIRLKSRHDGRVMHGWRLTANALDRITFGRRLCLVGGFDAPRTNLDLGDLTTFELIQTLQHRGWTWHKLPAKRDLRLHLFFDTTDVHALKMWYTAGVTVVRNYLLALLSADKLRAMGVNRIPHFGTEALFQALLEGRPLPAIPRSREGGGTQTFDLDVDMALGQPHGAWKRTSTELDGAGSPVPSSNDDLERDLGALFDDMGEEIEQQLRDSAWSDNAAALDEPSVADAKAVDGVVGVPPQSAPEPSDHPVGSSLLKGHKWHVFRITPKQAGAGRSRYGGWEATCPFHRRNKVSMCKKFISIASSSADAQDRAKRALAFWCVEALRYDRQWKHVAFTPSEEDAPEWPILDAEAACMAVADVTKTDAELDNIQRPSTKHAKAKARTSAPPTQPSPPKPQSAPRSPSEEHTAPGSVPSTSTTSSTSSTSSSSDSSASSATD